MDINALLSQLTGAGNQRMSANQEMTQRMDADTQAITNLLTTNTQETMQVIEASKQVAAQEGAVTYQVNKARETYTALAGMNPDDLNNQFVQSVAAYDASERERGELSAARNASMRKVEQLAGVNLLQNPLEYLFAQLQLPTVAAEHNSILNRENESIAARDAASRNIEARAAMIKTKDSLIAANTADTLLGVSTAKAELAAKSAQISLRQATADNISKLGTRALDAYRLGNDSFQIQSDLLNKAISIEQWKTSQAAAAEARAANRAAASDRLAAKSENDMEKAAFNQRLAAASLALGYAEPLTITSLKFLAKPQQDAIVEVALNGTFGNTLPAALDTIRSSGQVNSIRATNPGMGKFIDFTSSALKYYGDEVANKVRSGTLDKKTDVVSESAAEYSFELTQSMGSGSARHNLNSTKWNNDGIFNPYKPQYLVIADEAAGGGLPSLKGNTVLPIIERLRTNLAPSDTNLRGKDMENLVMSVSQQVANGKLGLDQAANDLTTLHRVAAAKNLQLFNYPQFGLPQQTSAIVTVPAVTAFGNPFKVDLMNPNDVKLNLARMAREQRMGIIGTIGNARLLQPFTPALGPLGGLAALIAPSQRAPNTPTE